jgi:epoxyqueuosine reductase QueG
MLSVLDELRAPLGAAGCNILLPLSPAAFDAATAPVDPALTLRALFPPASAAVVVASGGRDLFERFTPSDEARDGQAHPLDRFTARVVTAAAQQALGSSGVGYRLFFPFTSSKPALPFQRLGRAAGLGGPGPLGLQIHPAYGPWWAYRGLIAIAAALPAAPSVVGDGCAGCDAPCVAACPAGAVRVGGFSVADCHARRRQAVACQLSCAARIRCVRGPEHRYRDEQLAFHMAASMPR